MTTTLPRPATKVPTEPKRCAPPVGQDNTQPATGAPWPMRSTLAGGDNVPQEQSQVRIGTQVSAAMLLWDGLLQTLAAGLDDIESARIAQANRYRILTLTEADSDGEMRGFGLDDDHPAVAALAAQLATLKTLDEAMAKALAKQLKSHALYGWIKAQGGIGDKQAARLLAAIRDPYWNDLHDRPRTVSELWAFCGLHVLPASHVPVDPQLKPAGGAIRGGGDTSHRGAVTHGIVAGVAPARRRGQKMNWNNDARTRIYLIAESCMKQRRKPCAADDDGVTQHVDGCQCGGYRLVYDAGRAKYADSTHATPCARCGPKGKPAEIGTPLSDGHKHARAMRLVMKAILRDLWIESKRIYTAS